MSKFLPYSWSFLRKGLQVEKQLSCCKVSPSLSPSKLGYYPSNLYTAVTGMCIYVFIYLYTAVIGVWIYVFIHCSDRSVYLYLLTPHSTTKPQQIRWKVNEDFSVSQRFMQYQPQSLPHSEQPTPAEIHPAHLGRHLCHGKLCLSSRIFLLLPSPMIFQIKQTGINKKTIYFENSENFLLKWERQQGQNSLEWFS